ncbi:MAG: DMT family transporter [Paracoccus sp. (in: a-proteobacteria)]|uniref:DMT family transporter n=2 Tax=Paracoccus TaxID=265 RepID=UPI0018154253|nr:DMT family transporter [Paracoccus sp. UBA889]MCS5601804.1 DMT family transporter [Paracoccus sp. (in: a-proteobacteria)]HIC67130.1 DMT family transporter [Paracoccus sp. (in: a-proteobacteria)]|tara:strand:+ start:9 stop:965 length:957 start_codon:yes stop_codon:yes gene_type:complete
MPDDRHDPPHAASAAAASAPPPVPPRMSPPAQDRTGLGILLMSASALIFSMQDGFSRVLGAEYPPVLVVMIRYWVFAAFVIVLVSRQPGGLRRAVRTRRPLTQIARGVLLVLEVVVMVEAFVRLGLVETQAVFIAYPLLVAALSGPVLGEKVGWRRWAAIGIGFSGILVILQPGGGVMRIESLLPFLAAFMFALYGLLTRHVSRDDPSMVSFFWTGVAGAVAITLIGIWDWRWLAPVDWIWMAGLCICGMSSHYLMIRAYELAEASALQPFAYTQLVWASLIGVFVFGEVLRPSVVLGAMIVVLAGLFTLWRARVRSA